MNCKERITLSIYKKTSCIKHFKQNVIHKHVKWLTVTSPPQSRMWAQRHGWAVFSLWSVNDVPKIGSNCQNETNKAEDTKGGHKTGQTCESDFHFVWMQCLKRNSFFSALSVLLSLRAVLLEIPRWKMCCFSINCYCWRFYQKRAVWSTFRYSLSLSRSLALSLSLSLSLDFELWHRLIPLVIKNHKTWLVRVVITTYAIIPPLSLVFKPLFVCIRWLPQGPLN